MKQVLFISHCYAHFFRERGRTGKVCLGLGASFVPRSSLLSRCRFSKPKSRRVLIEEQFTLNQVFYRRSLKLLLTAEAVIVAVCRQIINNAVGSRGPHGARLRLTISLAVGRCAGRSARHTRNRFFAPR